VRSLFGSIFFYSWMLGYCYFAKVLEGMYRACNVSAAVMGYAAMGRVH
jgi:hypothetical protein